MGQDREQVVAETTFTCLTVSNAETINIKVADPLFVDVNHATDHFGLLGKQIVQPKEVAVNRIFAAKGGIAPVVIKDGVVGPGRYFTFFIAGYVKDRCIGEAFSASKVGKVPVIAPVVKGFAIGVQIREVLLVAVTVFTFLILDYVGGVVGNDVEKNLMSRL